MFTIFGHPFSYLDAGFIILVISGLFQVLLYFIVMGRVAFSSAKNRIEESYPPVSVVIAARNEEYNLQMNLPAVLEQDYPNFEVVVVNNASHDDSGYLLREMVHKYPHLSPVEMKQELNFFTGKKFPLSIGIKSAKHDALVFTDADCKPESDQWLKKMARNFDKNHKIVLGYGRLTAEPGFLNRLIRFDTLHVGMLYLGFAKLGMPYMGVGRNMAYSKSLFYAAKGFISHYSVSSGDDDLFVNRVATKKNCAVEIEQGSVTESVPKLSFRDYCIQKKRHFSSSSFYRFKHSSVLSMISATQWLLYGLTALLLFMDYRVWWIVLLPLFIRLITQLFITKMCMNKLGEKKLLLLSPLLELVLMVLHPILLLSSQINRQNKWK